MTTLTLHRRPRPQRGPVPRGFLVASSLVSGLAVAVGLQLAGPQLESRFAGWLGIQPRADVAKVCPVTGQPIMPQAHPTRNHTVAAADGIDVMPAI
jgi:hypothetical protein